MGTPEIGCIDGAEVLLHCMAQDPLVEQIGRLVQQIVLLDHVLGFEHGSRKHELPMERHTLAFEGHDVELLGIVDDRDMAFRGDGLSDRGPMVLGRRQACHHINGRKSGIDQRLVQGPAVVDHDVSAHIRRPGPALRTRCGGDDRQPRQLARKLNENRANAARAINDKQRPFR